MTARPSPFCRDSVTRAPTGTGPLDGLRLAVKDVFDLAGHITGCGNPDWARTHAPATATASVVDALLAAGATLVGKTLTDELAYSLNGENHHHGTPDNPRAPGRIPGGSSSGSASAVAQDLADVALGTDCGGSVRLPASFCGLYGMRPSHGRVATDGLVPLARSFDTVGWLASSADHLRRVGSVLLGDDPSPEPPRRLLIASDLFDQLGHEEQAALQPALQRLTACFEAVETISVGHGKLDAWMRAFRTLQAAEIWAAHGEWITRVGPRFGPGVQQRFDNAAHIAPTDVQVAQRLREAVAARMALLLAPGTLLCLPSAPGIAPRLGTPVEVLEGFRSQAMRLLCIAGLAGTPQVSLPVTTVQGCPLGLSLMASRGADRALLDAVAAWDLREPDADCVGAVELNRPEVLAEVSAAFHRYEQALIHNQVAVLDHLFLDSAHTVRYGATENLYGAAQIRAFRAARGSAGLMRELHHTVITTYGPDAATACTEFSRQGSARIGRQTQTWIRTPAGWKIVAAHVSLIDPSPSEGSGRAPKG